MSVLYHLEKPYVGEKVTLHTDGAFYFYGRVTAVNEHSITMIEEDDKNANPESPAVLTIRYSSIIAIKRHANNPH